MGDKEADTGGRVADSILLSGYLLKVHAEAWRGLCAEYGIDSEVLLQLLPGHDTLGRGERAAEAIAFTAEGVNVYLRREVDESARAVTPDEAFLGIPGRAMDLTA